MAIVLIVLFFSFSPSFAQDKTEENSNEDITINLNTKIETALEQFKHSKINPTFTLKFDDIVANQSYSELNDPVTLYPSYQPEEYFELSNIYQYGVSCKTSQKLEVKNNSFKKMLIWHNYVCGKISELPIHFFSSPPFIYPLGGSYVQLAINSHLPQFSQNNWASLQNKYTHSLEIINNKFDPTFKLNLTPNEWKMLLEKNQIIQNENYILIKNQSNYSAYKLDEWLKFLKSYELITVQDENGENCIVKESNLCWTVDSSVQKEKNHFWFIILCIIIAILIIWVVILLWFRSREKIFDQQQRIFTFQMLTHELRTPITSFGLVIESFRKNFDILPEQLQKSFLQLCEEQQKLRRVIETSEKYLRTSTHNMNLNKDYFDVNATIGRMIESYGDQLQFVALNPNKKFPIDVYWMELCLGNLIVNALTHGIPPVKLKLYARTEKDLYLEVSDGGELNESILTQKKIQEFQKGKKSKGLGLGLSIVKKVVSAMGGRLTIQLRPSTFTIELKDQ